MMVGCGPTVDDTAEGSATGSSGVGMADTGSVSASASSGVSTSSTNTGPMTSSNDDDEDDDGPIFPEDWGSVGVVCTPTDVFGCTQGVDCTQVSCGDPMSPFDADGCMRPLCPCDEGSVCFVPANFDGCASSGLGCVEKGGSCLCVADPDCGGSYCLPIDEVPIAPCLEFDDQAACEASNCLWQPGVRRQYVNGACECDAPTGICIAPLRYAAQPPGTTYYRFDAPDRSVRLDATLSPTPTGLDPCIDGGPVPVCDCAGLDCG